MDMLLYAFGAIVALFLLVAIAEPLRFLPEFEKKKKRVGSTYWGIYEGAPPDEPESMRTVELLQVARKERYIAGSVTYSQGRGVNMSGRK